MSSEKLIRGLSMFSLSGKLIVKQQSVGYSRQIEANNEKVLILKVMYEDGTSEVVKVANSK